VRAFEAIGGVPELVVPDNAKTAIVKASFYDPEVNRSYAEMATPSQSDCYLRERAAGVDVERSYQTAALDALVGREAPLQGPPQPRRIQIRLPQPVRPHIFVTPQVRLAACPGKTVPETIA
jgi:hypothetical protein